MIKRTEGVTEPGKNEQNASFVLRLKRSQWVLCHGGGKDQGVEEEKKEAHPLYVRLGNCVRGQIHLQWKRRACSSHAILIH